MEMFEKSRAPSRHPSVWSSPFRASCLELPQIRNPNSPWCPRQELHAWAVLSDLNWGLSKQRNYHDQSLLPVRLSMCRPLYGAQGDGLRVKAGSTICLFQTEQTPLVGLDVLPL